MHSTWIRIVVLLVFAAVVAGCGSDAPSLESWQEQAQSTCEDAEDTIQDAYDDWADNEGDLDEIADILEEFQPEYEDFVDEVKDLGVPSEDSDQVEELYDVLDEDLQSLIEVQAA